MFEALRRIPRKEKVAIGLSIGTGILLLAIKFAAYWITESSAIFSDAVESIVNVMASMVALWALAAAHTPPDEKHPYGHGKAEFLSAAFEGGMIGIAAIFIFVGTLSHIFFHQQEPKELVVGIVLMVAAMAVNGAIGFGLVRMGKTQKSATLEADGWHLLTDAVTSAAVLVALALVKLTGQSWFDPAVAFLIAGYVGWTGLHVARESFGGLMDVQDVEDEKALIAILDRHVGKRGAQPQICSYHKLRHRHSGRYHWVDFHIMVPAHLNVAEGHRIASEIEYEMEQMLGEGNATAHIEPCGSDVCEICGS